MSAIDAETWSPMWTVLSRAVVHAIFVILLSLLGEAVLIFLLNLRGQAWFTTLWAFFMASGVLAFFPTTYVGEPLGLGLARLSRSQASVVVTRPMRLAVFALYLGLVIGLSFLTAEIERTRGLTYHLDAKLAFPMIYLMINAVMVINNRRYL